MKYIYTITLSLIIISCGTEHKEYHENGQLKVEGRYNTNGQQIGVWKEYDKYGQIEREGSYNRKGQQTGVWKLYDGDFVTLECSYTNGLKNGLWKDYHFRSTQLESESNWSCGKCEHVSQVRIISEKCWDKNGNEEKCTTDWEMYDVNPYGTK